MSRFVFTAAILAVAISFAAQGIGGAAADTNDEQARRAAADAPAVAEVLTDHPDAELVGGRTDTGTWVFEIVAGDRELGVVVVSGALEVVEVELFEAEDEPDEHGAPDDGLSIVERLIPQPEGALYLWVSLAIVALIAWGPDWPGRLVLLAVVSWGLTWYLFWNGVATAQLALWVTNLIVLGGVTVFLLMRRVPRLATRELGGRAVVPGAVLLAWLTWLAVASAGVEDSAIWAARGGRYLIDEGAFPYGALGEGATYGPVQYLVHAPLTIIWPPGEIGEPSFMAARVVAVAAVLVMAWSVWTLLGKDRAGISTAIVILMVPWVPSVVAVANVSHLVPIACTLAAFVLVGRDTRGGALGAGALLGTGAGAMFVPAFAAPALVVASGRRWREVLAGLAGVAGVVLAVLVATGADLATVWNDTVRFQETAYAAEGGLSLWGQLGIERWRSAGKVLHVVVLLGSFAGAARHHSPAAPLLAAGVAIGGVLLWKGHVGPWGYLTWFVPLLLAGAMLAGRDVRASSSPWDSSAPQ